MGRPTCSLINSKMCAIPLSELVEINYLEEVTARSSNRRTEAALNRVEQDHRGVRGQVAILDTTRYAASRAARQLHGFVSVPGAAAGLPGTSHTGRAQPAG